MENRIASLDIIRGIAAFSVFFSHLGNPISENYFSSKIIDAIFYFHNHFLWANGGLHWAVVVFVVLSGFCIHLPAARKNSDKISFLKFILRRFLRIYPVYIAAFMLGIVVHYDSTVNSSVYFENFILNVFLVSGILPVSGPFGNPILLTVIVEMILYILYPIMLDFARSNWTRFFFILLLLHFLNFSLLFKFELDPTWVQRNLFSFLIYWWIGVFFCEIKFNGKYQFINFRKWYFPILLYLSYLLFCHTFIFTGSHVFKSLFLAMFTGYLLLYMTDRSHKNSFNIKFFPSIFIYLGLFSYSLYVFHSPILKIINEIATGHAFSDTLVFYLLNIFVVGVICSFLFFIIEKKFHKYSRMLKF